VLNALEPEWEALFEACSYGFRPGKSYQDAIHRIHTLLSKKDFVWVVDADMTGCFDNIDYSFLMERVKHFPYADLLQKWLKTGILEGGIVTESDTGTPQGGVISPLVRM
jgi:RNA-directed DNA polymerase